MDITQLNFLQFAAIEFLFIPALIVIPTILIALWDSEVLGYWITALVVCGLAVMADIPGLTQFVIGASAVVLAIVFLVSVNRKLSSRKSKAKA